MTPTTCKERKKVVEMKRRKNSEEERGWIGRCHSSLPFALSQICTTTTTGRKGKAEIGFSQHSISPSPPRPTSFFFPALLFLALPPFTCTLA
mmetsp:Transcript_20659/g.53143  ORF Transcript_20659/g.53143 Transcript_20659/m.53143 type:complete len:92 (+) Transcript_20659:1812-2087(+)